MYFTKGFFHTEREGNPLQRETMIATIRSVEQNKSKLFYLVNKWIKVVIRHSKVFPQVEVFGTLRMMKDRELKVVQDHTETNIVFISTNVERIFTNTTPPTIQINI